MDSLDAMEDKSKFLAVYEILKSEILSDPSIQGTEKLRQVVEKMLDYNVPNGKLHRGLSVVRTYKILKGGEVSEEEFFLACVLGWCIEWLQACCLVLDDIMDDSHTRRSQLCWFRLPEVGNLAIFDGMLLYCQKGRILNTYFHSKDFYPELLELFNEVEFQTGCGQMLDLITCHETVELRKCNLLTYLRIVKYKTSYYSFYLPVACALLMAGENLDDHVPVKNILVKMGNYFQIQDDYLDCFGDPAVIGKIGTDIEDFKCSWLLVQALERANHEQLLRLHANYGKKDPSCVSEVKALYKELGLQNVFWDYENTTHKELIASIEEVGSPPLQCILESFVKQIYRRLK